MSSELYNINISILRLTVLLKVCSSMPIILFIVGNF